LSESYIRWYSLTVNNVFMILIPTAVMVYCSYEVYARLKEVKLGALYSARV